MPLVDLKTDLKSLRFGKDRKGGGNSGQPYIKTGIPETPFEEAITSPIGVNDFLLRGGLNAVTDTAEDVLRLGKMFTSLRSPSGLLFTAKQKLLSRTAVRTQTSGILNEGTYTPLSTLAQAGVNAFGGHLNKQGINPFALTGAYSNNPNLYSVKVKSSQPKNENRLIGFYDSKIEKKTSNSNLYSYIGGPGSDLGIGKTNIRFADQRTGLKNVKLPKGTDGGPSFIQVTGPNDYSALNSARFFQELEPNITGNESAAVNIRRSAIIKSNIFHKGATNSFLNAQIEGDSPGGFFELLSDLEEGYSLNLAEVNNYSAQPEGGLRTFLPNVYEGGSGSLQSTTSNEYIMWNYGAELLDQQQLYTASLNNVGDRQQLNPADFREVKRQHDRFQRNAPVSSILSLAPDYVTQNKNTMFNQGDPGKSNPTTDSMGDPGLGKKNVWNYAFSPSGSMAKTALDKINALAPHVYFILFISLTDSVLVSFM